MSKYILIAFFFSFIFPYMNLFFCNKSFKIDVNSLKKSTFAFIISILACRLLDYL